MTKEKFSETLSESADVLVKPVYNDPIVSELLMCGIDNNRKEFLFEFYNQSPYFVDAWRKSYEIAAKRDDITDEEKVVFEDLIEKLDSIYNRNCAFFNESIGTFNRNKPSKPASLDMWTVSQTVIKEASLGSVPELLVSCIAHIIIADLITRYIKSHPDYVPNIFQDVVFDGFRCGEFANSLMELLDKRIIPESERSGLTLLFNRTLSLVINTVLTIISDSRI